MTVRFGICSAVSPLLPCHNPARMSRIGEAEGDRVGVLGVSHDTQQKEVMLEVMGTVIE